MTIERQTIIDQIEIIRNGVIQIRFGLLLVEDGVEIDCKWHRTAVEPGGDVDAQIAAVNAHLASMGKARVEDTSLLNSIAAVVHTPEKVATFTALLDK